MLISKNMNGAINRQIGYEFSAMLQYVAIGSHFIGESLHQLAAYFYRQAGEERDHAMRFIKYVLDAGGRVEIGDIPAPQNRFKNAQEAVQLSLDQEMKVTEQINRLVELAIKESDHITQNALAWFVNEQLKRSPAWTACSKSCSVPATRTCFTSRITFRVTSAGAPRRPPPRNPDLDFCRRAGLIWHPR